MNIKYTGLYEEISIQLFQFKFYGIFKRNTWKDIPENVAEYILKNNDYFFSEKEALFSQKDFLQSGRNICLVRFGALGDILMLIPIMHYFKRISTNKYTLATEQRNVEVFKNQDIFHNVIPNTEIKHSEYDRVIFLDGVLEADHDPNDEDHLIHRTKLYEKFFGVKLDEYDFSMKISDEDYQYARKLLNVSCVQQIKM